MTGKRLIVRDGDYAWIDTVTDTVIEVEDAFDLVNNLAEENEQLKSQNRLLKGKLHRLRMEKGALEEEIECLGEETIEQFRKDLQNGEFIELTSRPNVRKHKDDYIGWNWMER